MATRKPIIYINGYPSELDIASDLLKTLCILKETPSSTRQKEERWDTTKKYPIKNGMAVLGNL